MDDSLMVPTPSQTNIAIRRSTVRPLLLLAAVSLLALVGPSDVLRGESIADPEIAVESGADGLDGGVFPKNWYDSSKDDLRPLNLRKPKQAKKPKPATNTTQNSGFWSWLDGLMRSINPNFTAGGLFQFLAWTALAVALVLIAWWFVRAYQRNERKQFEVIETVDSRATSIDRVEALPLDVQEDVSDLLAAARRYYQSGDLELAIVYLFSHQLLELDKHHLIRLVKGKTNRQYLREIKRNASAYPQLHQLTRETIRLFEEIFFGKHEPDRAAMASCWNQIDQFESLVQQAAREGEQL